VQVLGRLEALIKVMSLENDQLGMELVREQLPQRVRARGSKSRPGRSADAKSNGKVTPHPDELEGF